VWHAHIKGPAGTPYEGGHFELLINFPEGACGCRWQRRWQAVVGVCGLAGSTGTLPDHRELD